MIITNEAIAEHLKKNKGKKYIWGSAFNGMAMYLYLQKRQIEITGFIDSKEAYNGQIIIDNLTCELPPPMTEQDDSCIITVSEKAVNAVYNKCMELGFSYIYICDPEEINEFKSEIDDKTYLSIMWNRTFGTKLNLEDPKTFNEKLQWLKLYDRKNDYTKLTDKYSVRRYVEKTIGKEYLVPVIGVYEKFEDIDFKCLPDKFVMKCTHDSGSSIICKNKADFDYCDARKKMKNALNKNYFYNWREWPYKNIKPRIIIEELIETSDGKLPLDFKVHCFKGRPDFFSVAIDRETNLTFNYYDSNYNMINDIVIKKRTDWKKIQLPDNTILDRMYSLAHKLSENIPYLRVDFFVEDTIHFSELTFFPDAGVNPDWTDYWQRHVGEMINLEGIRNEVAESQ